MADVRYGGRRPLLIFLTVCVTVVVSLFTEEDLLLLSKDQNIPHCFSRNFMKITCYWEAKELETGENVACGFYYSYEEEPEEECDILIQNSPALYVCEHDDVRLFNDLHVVIKDKNNNQILRNRTIQVELFGIFPYPGNIRVTWDESRDQILVKWHPPESEFPFVLQYEVQYWSEDSTDKQQKIVLGDELKLTQFKPNLRYQLHVRTSWMGENAIWGPWSEVITFDTPGYSDIAGLKCFTSDLTLVCCQWREKIWSMQVFYRYSEAAWQSCKQASMFKDCDCTFLARNDSAVSLKIKVPSMDGNWSLYYPKPFWIHHVVLPPVPDLQVQQLPGNMLALNWSIPLPELEEHLMYQIRFSQDDEMTWTVLNKICSEVLYSVLPPVPDLQVQQLPGNMLALNWSIPLPELEEHLMYQIRFSQDDEMTWTILQVPVGARNKTLPVVSGTSYVLQLRAAPNTERIQGFWSDWSAGVKVKIPSSIGWIILAIALCLLSILAVVLCVCCKFPFLYRKLKNKLWPPVPNLHRVLDTFLAEIQKQYQPDSTVYEKTLEDISQPSSLEILSEVTPSIEGQISSRDYVQLSPPTYQNDDYWPKLELLDLHLELNTKNQPPSALINQTYLPTSWSL
ncbi:thrombopoietin receptor [Pyxicephalus adspersus]|uniref:thrombopoietin receptor n=1 Tax=Pyxicephalus adspersus TaxID=30357 RepID=UPI003B5B1EB6